MDWLYSTKKERVVLSSYYTNEMATIKKKKKNNLFKEKSKSLAIDQYAKSMGSVDHSDLLISSSKF